MTNIEREQLQLPFTQFTLIRDRIDQLCKDVHATRNNGRIPYLMDQMGTLFTQTGISQTSYLNDSGLYRTCGFPLQPKE